MADNYAFLEPGETILMQGRANKQQFLGINKGGMLILTDRRLVFIAHALNIGSKFDQIPFADIALTGNTLNLLVPSPNMIRVVLKNGKSESFVVSGKEKEQWKAGIAQAVRTWGQD